jgi:hypothetical protein
VPLNLLGEGALIDAPARASFLSQAPGSAAQDSIAVHATGIHPSRATTASVPNASTRLLPGIPLLAVLTGCTTTERPAGVRSAPIDLKADCAEHEYLTGPTFLTCSQRHERAGGTRSDHGDPSTLR